MNIILCLVVIARLGGLERGVPLGRSIVCRLHQQRYARMAPAYTQMTFRAIDVFAIRDGRRMVLLQLAQLISMNVKRERIVQWIQRCRV